jgi:uncharacterized protein (DUF4213/DUF364 family)
VAEVRIGLVYTGVRIEGAGTGVALTLPPPKEGDCCRHFDEMLPLAGRPAADLLAGLRSGDPVERAVGLACANALCNVPATDHSAGDVRASLDLRATDHVGMVGHFRPVVADIERRAARLTIFELIDRPEGRLRPAHEAVALLPECDLALVTATSLVSDTIDALLRAAQGCRQVVILGATTPLVAEAFAGTNVSALSGVVVRDAAAVLQVISEGGGMQRFKRYVDKVSLAL